MYKIFNTKIQQIESRQKDYKQANYMQEKPSQTANKIASKIFNQLQQNQLLRFKLRQYESYIDQSKENYERLITSQQKVIDLLIRQIKLMEKDSNRSKSFYLNDSSHKNKQSHIASSQSQQSWKQEYIILVDKIQNYVSRMCKLVNQFGQRDKENRQLVGKATKQLQKSYKLYKKSEKIRYKTLQQCQNNFQEAQGLIEHLIVKNQQLGNASKLKDKQIMKITTKVLQKDQKIKQAQKELQEAYQQSDELRQQIMLVLEGNQKLKDDIKYLNDRSSEQAKRMAYLQKKIIYYQGLQQNRKRQKQMGKSYSLQTQTYIDQEKNSMQIEIESLRQIMQSLACQKQLLQICIEKKQKIQFQKAQQMIQTQARLKEEFRSIHEKQQEELRSIHEKQKQQTTKKMQQIYSQNQFLQTKVKQGETLVANIQEKILQLNNQYQSLQKRYEQIEIAKNYAESVIQSYEKKLNEKSQQIRKLEDIKSWKNQQVRLQNQQFKDRIEILEKNITQKDEKIKTLEDLLFTQFQQMKQHKQTHKVSDKVHKQAPSQRSINSLLSFANNQNRFSQTLRISTPTNQSCSFNQDNNFFESRGQITFTPKQKNSFRLDLAGNTESGYILIKEQPQKHSKFDLASFKNKIMNGSHFSFYNGCNI